jgi:type IV pilus assembly protein PilC
MEVESRDEAVSRLKRDGLQVVELEEESAGLGLIPRRVRQTDIIYATSQLAVMVDTGITLSVALQSIAQHEQNGTLKEILLDMQTRVESGEDFSSALARYPQHFDKTFIALIRSSEQTGTLAEMLKQCPAICANETRQKSAAMAQRWPCWRS